MKLKIYGRFSFVNVHTAKEFTGDDGKIVLRYDINVLIPKGDKQIPALEQAREDLALAKFEKQAAILLPKLIAADKTFLRDGDSKPYAGYEGHYFVAAASYVKPLVIDAARNRLEASSGRPYGGAYGWISVDAYAMRHPKGGHQINASLKGVQFVRDGEPFAGGPPASEDDFDDLSVEDEATIEEADNFKASRELARQDRARDTVLSPAQARQQAFEDTRGFDRMRTGEETVVPAQRQTMGRRVPDESASTVPSQRRRLV